MIVRLLLSILFIPIAIIVRSFSTRINVFYSKVSILNNSIVLYEYFKSRGSEAYFIDDAHLTTIDGWIKAYFKVVRAENLFLTHGFGNLFFSVFFSKRIQLWHGAPFKEILLDHPHDYGYSTLRKKIYALRLKISYDYLVVGNGLMAEQLIKAFGFPRDKVINFGNPIITRLIEDRSFYINAFEVGDNKKKIVYMPTWRENIESVPRLLSLLLCDEVKSYLKDSNSCILIKPHPFQYRDFKNEFDKYERTPQFMFYEERDGGSIDHLISADLIISDYSSVVVDYAIAGVPFVLFTPDIEEYTSPSRGRAMYEYFFNIPRANTIKELVEKLSKNEVCDKGVIDTIYNSPFSACQLLYEKFSIG